MQNYYKYTLDEKEFLRENIKNSESYACLAKELNAKFNKTHSASSVSDQCIKQLKISIGKNASRFKNGSRARAVPIGTIRTASNGCTYIKIAENSEKYTGYKEPWWIPLQKKIYEDAYGKIEDDKMVCFLNCNRHDFSLDNLYPISRKTSALLAVNGWWSNDRNVTLTAIKWCELFLVMK